MACAYLTLVLQWAETRESHRCAMMALQEYAKRAATGLISMYHFSTSWLSLRIALGKYKFVSVVTPKTTRNSSTQHQTVES